MSRTKKYVKKVDFVEAYQVDPKSRDRDTVQMNQSGYYEPAYHGMITTSHVSWVEPGDYVIKLPNDIWMAMKKDEFESMYEPMKEVSEVATFPQKSFNEVSLVHEELDTKITNIETDDDDPFKPAALGPQDEAPQHKTKKKKSLRD